nr:hypothetical protein [Rhodopirellula sp. SM50]
MKNQMLRLVLTLIVVLPIASGRAADSLVIVDSSGSMQESTPDGVSRIDAAFGGGGYNDNPQLQFEKVLGDKRTGTRQWLSHVRGKQVTLVFKITKRGRKYTADVYAPTEKEDEMAWVRIGEQTLLRCKPRLGFYAWNRSADSYGRGPAHEVNICFERVVVRPIE